MRSDAVKKGLDKAPARSLLRADGLDDEDFEKPFIGITNSWNDIVPGHIHLNEIVEAVKEGIIEAGGKPFARPVESRSCSESPRYATVSPWDTRA